MAKKKPVKFEKSSITPLGDRVLLEVLKNESKTASGIILPDNYSEDKGMKEGRVVAVGQGKLVDGKYISLEVSKGDKVLFQWGDEIKIDGKEYLLVNESSIVAIIN
jgi:chaperonin GroES